MEIISLGHSGFRLRGKDTTVVIDPPSSAYGMLPKGITANIVCITHNHPGHSNIEAIAGSPYIVQGPGEYEVAGILITALRSFHDNKKGEERGDNTIYLIHMEDMMICHLGDLGHTLNATQQQAASGADILMIPVGGHTTINAATAVEVIGEIEPSIIIPMHYATGTTTARGEPLDPVDTFCKAMGVPMNDPQAKIVVTRSTIPAEPQVIILSHKG